MTVQVHVNSTDRSWHLVALENLDTFVREAFKATPENTNYRSVTGLSTGSTSTSRAPNQTCRFAN